MAYVISDEELAGSTKKLVAIFSNWKLSNKESAALLDVSMGTWRRIKDGTFKGSLNFDKRMRVDLITKLDKELTRRVSEPVATWIKTPVHNSTMMGYSPLQQIIRFGMMGLVNFKEVLGLTK